MKDECEICTTPFEDDLDSNLIELHNKDMDSILDEMFVCNDCYIKYEFTIGVIELDEEK